MSSNYNAREIIVIDAAVADWKTLTAGLSPDIPVILLPAGGNGLAALADALAGYGALDTLHVVSHGGTGRLNLGDLRLTADNLGTQTEALSTIASHLRPDSDVLLYGCSVAAGPNGQAFVNALSTALQGTDIAASTDRTGPLALGGDWDLEYAQGAIESVLPFTFQGMNGIDHCLSCTNGATNYPTCTGGGGGDTTPPAVSSINRVSATPSNATSIQYTVTFSENVSGVGTSDFTLTSTGTASGTVNSVSGGSKAYTVTVNSITGDGTLRLDLNSSGTGIKDTSNNNITTGFTSGQTYTFDNTAPSAPSTPDLAAGSDSGSSSTDDITNDTTPAITGTAEANATVNLYDTDGITVLGTTTANGSGDWSITSSTLSEGAHTLTAKATDAAGNTGSASSSLSVTIDTSAPAAPGTPDMTGASDSGTSSTDNITSTTAPTLNGTAEANATVTLYDTDGTTELGTTTANGSGKWSMTSSTLSEGTHTLTAKATDAAGNTGSASSNLSVTIDTTAPSIPGSITISDSALKVGDTATVTFTFDGAVTDFTTDDVTVANGALSGLSSSDGGTTWTATLTPSASVTDTSNLLTVSLAGVSDTAGNAGSGSKDSGNYTVDTVRPSLASSISISDTALKIGDTATVTFVFNEAVTGFTTADVTAPSGTLSSLTSGDGGTTWTATLTPASSTTQATNVLTLDLTGLTDLNGNAGTGSDTGPNYAVDTARPAASIVVADTALTAGETSGVTITFSEAVTGFGNSDLTIDNGSLSAVNSSDGGITWTATFTPTPSITDATNVITLDNTGVADAAGNAGSGTTDSNNYAIDTNASLTSATYNASTNVLTVTAANMTTGDTIDTTKLTLTGEGGGTYPLAGTYTVTASSATSFSVTLDDTDARNVEGLLNYDGTVSVSSTTYNLAGAANWDASRTTSADLTGNGVTVSNTQNPAIASATYDASTGVLTVTGSNMVVKPGVTNDITVSKLTLRGEDSTTRTLTSADVELTSSTEFSVTLNAADQAAVNQLLNKAGSTSTGGTTYNLAAALGWNTNVNDGNLADNSNSVLVSSVPVPTITSATYDASTGALVLTGTGFLKLTGDTNEIVANKFTFTAEGGATYTLTDTANVETTSGTAATITLSATDKAAINQIVNKNGTSSTDNTTYNIAADEDWAAGAAAGVTDADLTGNAITASNVAAPTITSATYNTNTGALVVTGTGFLKRSGAINDIVANKFAITGQDNTPYTLTDTANVDITSATGFTLTLSSTDRTAVNLLINKSGTQANDTTLYNLAAGEDWAAGAASAVTVADTSGNGITATVNTAPTFTSFGAAVANASEDVQQEITLTQLKAQGNQADSDGTVDAFIVKAVSNGTLKIGTSAGTATTWAAGTNDTIDATHAAYWIGGANAHGNAINAFTVVAKDNGGLESTTTAVQATVNVAAVNDTPTGSVTISGTPTQGQTLSAAHTLGDADGMGGVSYQWLAGSTVVGSGDTFTLGQDQVGKAMSVRANYTDADGTAESMTSGSTAVVVNINDAPTGTLAISGTPTQGQTLTADHSLADLDGLGALGFQWLAGSTVVGTSQSLTLTQAQVGQSLSVKISYTDGYGNPESISSSPTSAVANLNDAPSGMVGISGTPTQGKTLTAYNTLGDVDGLGTITYQWLDGDQVIGSGDALTPGQAQVGKSLSVRASYTDGYGTLESVSSAPSAPVANVNDRPSGTVTISGTPTQGQTLKATNTLADIDGLGQISYVWYCDGSAIGSGDTFTLTQAQVGQFVSVQASYTDAWGTLEHATTVGTSQRVANLNDAPTGSVAINGTPALGQTLTASHTLADLDGLGIVTYQWLVGDTVVGDGPALTLAQAQVGQSLTVRASYTDGYGTPESVRSAASAPVANVNITPTGSVTISGTPTQGQTLSAQHTLGDANGIGPINYQWLAGSTVVGSGDTFTLGQDQVGKAMSVRASYTDGGATAESVTSAPTAAVANRNDAPTGSVTISGTPTQGQTLAAAHTLADIDGLGTVSYDWFAGEQLVGTGPDFLLTQSQVGQRITVQAHYTDGYGAPERVASAASSLVAPPPVLSHQEDGVTVQTSTSAREGITYTTLAVQPVTAQRVEDPSTRHTLLADLALAKDAGGAALLELGLPVGVGMSAQGASASATASGLRTQLLDAASAHVSDPGALDGSVGPGIDGWLAGVGEASQVTLRTVTLSADSALVAPPLQPIVFTGTQNGHQEALVVESRTLPQGSAVQFDHVEFALVAGAVRAQSTTGPVVLLGDGANQFMTTGGQDDVLRGGAGDDTLGGSGGADALYGDAGQDLLVGGMGKDTLQGGTGDDVLQGGQSDAGTWRIAISASGALHSSFVARDGALTDVPAYTQVGAWVDPQGNHNSDDRLAYSYQPPQRLKLVASLVHGVADRLPTLEELGRFGTSALSDLGLAQAAYDYYQATHTGLAGQPLAAQVRSLADALWGTGVASDALVASGVDFISQGGTWAQGLLALAQATPASAHLTDSSGTMALAQPYTTSELGWSIDIGDDVLFGGDGNDRLVGGRGNDVLDGGTGTDMAVFSGAVSDYHFHMAVVDGVSQMVLTNVNSAEVDTLSAIELGQIGSKFYALSNQLPFLTLNEERPLSDFVVELTPAQVQLIGIPGA